MSTIDGFKHFANLRNREVIILGFNAANGNCMVCDFAHLPGEDAKELRMIASSLTAQRQDYLIPLLSKEQHTKAKMDWFTFLARHLHQNRGVVFNIPLKELDNMNSEQKGVFKGYKKPVAEAKKAELATPWVGNVNDEPDYTDAPFATHQGTPDNIAPYPAVSSAPPANDNAINALNHKIDALTMTLVEELRALRTALVPAPVEAPKKRAYVRKAAK